MAPRLAVDIGLGQAHVPAQVVGRLANARRWRQTAKAAADAAKSVAGVERPARGRGRVAVTCAMAFPFDSLNTIEVLISMLDIWSSSSC
jgi:hypothetical protein